jgi:CheY-like chemotaxis protein
MMSISQAILRHVPYLRRFARALSGSREGGDAYVLATLETAVADPTRLVADEDLKISLYRLFLEIWTSSPINDHTDTSGVAPGDEASARRNLDAISLQPRIAFLLHALEGFSLGEIARALSVSEARAAALIDTASAEIAGQLATDVLIIEDEPVIAADIAALVNELGHRVTHIAATREEAAYAAARERPGLVLADIQLADGSSGIDAVRDILTNLDTPVIFITAFPERLLTGERPEPTFLITKPFQPETVKAAIGQALFFHPRRAKVGA